MTAGRGALRPGRKQNLGPESEEFEGGTKASKPVGMGCDGGGGEGVGRRVQNQVLRALRGQREPCTDAGAASPGLVPTREGAAGRAPEERQPRAPCPGSPGPAPPSPRLGAPRGSSSRSRTAFSRLPPVPALPGGSRGNVSESGSGLETITDSVGNSLLRENSQRGLRSASRGEQPGLCGLCGAGTKRSAPRPARRVPAPEPLWRSCPRRDLTRP